VVIEWMLLSPHGQNFFDFVAAGEKKRSASVSDCIR
jgi:hypothetical protein